MKKLFTPLVAIAAILLLSFISVDPLTIGSAVPKSDKKLKDVSGKETTLKESLDKNGLLVMFSCNTCPYVIKNQQRTKDICKYAQKNAIGVVLSNSNEGNRAVKIVLMP